eukprot:g23369.t1
MKEPAQTFTYDARVRLQSCCSCLRHLRLHLISYSLIFTAILSVVETTKLVTPMLFGPKHGPQACQMQKRHTCPEDMYGGEPSQLLSRC